MQRIPTPRPARRSTLTVSILLSALVAACGDEKPRTPTSGANGTGTGQTGASAPSPLDATAITLARERVAALVADQQRTRAREALAPLVTRPDAALEDLIRAAAIEFGDNRPDAADAYLKRAEALSPTAPEIAFLRGQMARESGDSQKALAYLKAAHAARPDDLPTTLVLGAVADDLDDVAEAERLYRQVVAVGLENGQTWYAAAVIRLASLLSRGERPEDAAPFFQMARDLEKRKVKMPDTLQMLLGEFGRVRPPAPSGSTVAKLEPPRFRAEPVILPELSGATTIEAVDVDDDLSLDLLSCGPRGAFVALRRGATYAVIPVGAGACEQATSFDADNDGDLDVLCRREGRLTLFEFRDGAFHATTVAFPALPSAPTDLVAVDYDHEGDLDLLLVGAFGARVWRRDGTPALEKVKDQPKSGAVYTDATAESGLPTTRAFAWCRTEDFDGDNDVDFLLGGPNGPALFDSLRGGKFAEKAGAFDVATPVAPIVADLDGDARTDLWVPGTPSTFAPSRGAKRASIAARVTDAHATATADFDLDGSLDVAFVDGNSTLKLALAPGLAAERALDTQLGAHGPLCAGDLDGDGRADLATADADGVHVFTNQGPTGHGARWSFRGGRDNARGVGLILEVRAGTIYRRVYGRGEPTLVGLGASTLYDVARVTWPNGVSATQLDLDPKSLRDGVPATDHVPQPSGLYGSCPFLYTWNGTTYEFISDVLGSTPLGLPIAPGMLVPPDHDEYVLVRGEQMAPKDGVFEAQLTEELREVTYFDHARLVVVDHPADTEVYPNELFCFPPFPTPHTHTVKAPLSPVRATGSDGKDWTKELSRIDDVHAVPFTLQPSQFVGLARPWFVELEFDRAAVARASKLRLLLTGWFFWSDASANMAGARNPEAPFIPPMFQVPDGQGGWRDAGPPVGFPTGKTKTMVVDVANVLSREDPRIRVFQSLRLYWDAARLAVDGDDAPLVVRELPCTDARVWRRGFSAPLARDVRPGESDPRGLPERFDWDRLADAPRWNQHPGLYTRYGECRELVDAVDDRFVILGSGDALTLRFAAVDPATKQPLAPPAAGMRRDYLIYMDGWAKDRDPNTVQALEVEPLPFHGMSGYPYRDDERFPDDDAHRRWRAEWNTRPAWEWIRPVSPQRQDEWLLSVPPRR